MISAENAIRALRRDLTISSFLKFSLLGIGLVCLLMGPIFGSGTSLTIIILVVGGVWLLLSYRSAKGSSLAADSPLLIASGQFDEAEEHIEQVLRSFSLFRAVKLLSLHHLAVLRHAQRRWRESALLSQALLHQRLGSLESLGRSNQLMLADSLLELGDLAGAHQALAGLYRERLTLGEAMNLLVVQLDYECRISAWGAMTKNMVAKVQLAELMSAPSAAKTQAFLALAAMKQGRDDWAKWLAARAALLVDANALVVERPVLAEVFGDRG
jgi:hypothetical protein